MGSIGPKVSSRTMAMSWVTSVSTVGCTKRAPSSVTTEPLSARPSGDAISATSQACSSGRPSRPSGTERAAPARTGAGYFWIASVSK